MDRREFLKMMSMMAAGFALFGCRDGMFGPTVKAAKKTPSLADFENEVRLALSMQKSGFNLVRVPMPEALKTPGASQENRFGMAIDLDACDGCGKCVLACIQENNIALAGAERAKLGQFMHWIEMHGEFLRCASIAATRPARRFARPVPRTIRLTVSLP